MQKGMRKIKIALKTLVEEQGVGKRSTEGLG